MKNPSHVAAAPTSPSPHPSAVSGGAPIPWLPLPPSSSSAGASATIASAPSERWAAALQKVPYLHSILEGPTCTVYRPPTVIQLSEATGCSVSKLAGAYSDLPVITLNKIRATSDQEAAAAAAAGLNSDGFEYLQLSPTDDSLEMAAKALVARRPAPDAEEIFWEAEYWEVLRRAKRQAQEEKERLREKKLGQRERRAVMGASNSSVGVPSPKLGGATTLSSMNSPSFATPHSRQGSLGGPPGDCGDGSPAYLHAQTAAQRTAKGLLRRARYNETHNPAQRVLVRTASLLSQNSATQSVIRCRTRPRHDSITSQQTLSGARGFQYPLSSLASEDGRSATSDSFRTPPPPIAYSHQSRELLAASLELELSTSGGPAKTGTTTRSGTAPAEGAKGEAMTARETARPHNEGGSPIATRDAARKRPSTAAAAVSPDSSSSLQISSNRCSTDLRRSKVNSFPSVTASPRSSIVQRDSATSALLIIPAALPALEPSAQQRPPPPPLQGDSGNEQKCRPLLPRSVGAIRKPVEKQPPVAEGGREGRGGGGSSPQPLPPQPQLLSLSAMPRTSVGRPSGDTSSLTVDGQPRFRCTTARPSPDSNARANSSASSRPSGSAPGTSSQLASVPTVTGELRKAKSALAALSPVVREVTATVPTSSPGAPFTAAEVKVRRDAGKRLVTRADLKPLPLHPSSAQPPLGHRLDGASAPDKAFRLSSTPPCTAAVTAAASPAPPHSSFSSSTAQTTVVPQSASMPVMRAPVPKPLPSAEPAVPPAITVISTAAPSPSSSVTTRTTATAAPSSCLQTREASPSPCLERAAVVVRAASSIAPKDGADATSSTTSRVTVAPPTATKPPSAVTKPLRNGEAPLTSRQNTTVATNAKDAKGEEAQPPAQVPSTPSKAEVAPPQPSNRRADEDAAARPSCLSTLSFAADAERDAHNAPESGATAFSLPSRKVDKEASRCCVVL
ncbi:conserved hypothetical protein [Leishmania major strain Friedlin]|uniref:Uncharacterized protein n=1 Tax=Leishmania major TaxID=5664 RepID=Q4Q4Z8_LEIMA|nr:conserved hypothetical protein [Leishmania major strain Friedlin]CAG9580415.1 hypothetical_protein_-_conserved [Leishmania major strain Friedlin]CAJ08804.1 conserved hypothetical protein [Leishmania major strain Friedlin]|eukprot:XP_001685600.1 conserved hypothetical protein [Leishmania major strain Friedlin]